MTTQNYSTPIEHTSDATFRAWAQELSDALTNAGFIKTSDTGQITIASATRPGAGSAAGYEVRQMNDTLQATAPVYLKLEYGTNSASSDRPGIWITIGTGTNGSGTLSGVFFPRSLIGSPNGINSTSTNYPTWICHVDGFLGIAHKVGYSSATVSSVFTLVIQRTVDSSGDPTAEGVMVHYNNSGNNTSAYSKHFASGFVPSGVSLAYAMVPFGITSSLVSGGPQVFTNVMVLPEVRKAIGTLTVLASEISGGTQFQATPVGLTQRNYLGLGAGGTIASVNNTSAHVLAMLWE